MEPHRALLSLLLCSQALAQLVVPQRMPLNTTGELDALSHVLGVEGRPNTACLQPRALLPSLSYPRASVCGNGVVEPGEQCDCGTAEACLKDNCCTKNCQFKPGVKCSSGPCCHQCQFRPRTAPCRPAADAQCDLPEFCNGSSASCPPDLYVQDGHSCEHRTSYCYKGRCQSPDLHCRRLFGPGSRNAPVVCYEEVNIQQDRFGHCGFQPRQGYRSCSWRNLRCGKLICTYPHHTPFASAVAAVLYVQVRQHLCISLNYLNAPARLDPLLVPPGTRCGPGKVCINNTCQPHSVLGYDCNPAVKCHGHGVCNNKKHCHCHPGWNPPDCRQKGSPVGSSIDSHHQLTDRGRALAELLPSWLLLGSCLILLVLQGLELGQSPRKQSKSTQGPTAEEGSDRLEPDLDLDSDSDTDLEFGPELDLGPVLYLELDLELGP